MQGRDRDQEADRAAGGVGVGVGGGAGSYGRIPSSFRCVGLSSRGQAGPGKKDGLGMIGVFLEPEEDTG